MSKYIPAEKLIKSIEEKGLECSFALKMERLDTLALIESLQQEQPKQQNGKFVFPKYLYARTKDNKTIDMSYAPQDMTAIEYVRNDFVEQEQPEVDLEKEIDEKWDEFVSSEGEREDFTKIARHFYGLRNRALEEAARNVYESWMGGTMDDVRRDMVELGKVLNARKK